MLDPRCNAAIKCWEHYQPNEPRVSQAQIRVAFTTLTDTVNTADCFDVTSLQNIVDQAENIINLIGQQWRDMVRKPFNFPTTPTSQSPNISKRATVDDLLI